MGSILLDILSFCISAGILNDDYTINQNIVQKLISLGKLLLCIIGKRLSIEESRYNEIHGVDKA